MDVAFWQHSGNEAESEEEGMKAATPYRHTSPTCMTIGLKIWYAIRGGRSRTGDRRLGGVGGGSKILALVEIVCDRACGRRERGVGSRGVVL